MSKIKSVRINGKAYMRDSPDCYGFHGLYDDVWNKYPWSYKMIPSTDDADMWIVFESGSDNKRVGDFHIKTGVCRGIVQSFKLDTPPSSTPPNLSSEYNY